jgi:hypothetical protein
MSEINAKILLARRESAAAHDSLFATRRKSNFYD